jgi:hypothetical protein
MATIQAKALQAQVPSKAASTPFMQNKTRTYALFVAEGTRNSQIQLSSLRSRLLFARGSIIHLASRVVRQRPSWSPPLLFLGA